MRKLYCLSFVLLVNGHRFFASFALTKKLRYKHISQAFFEIHLLISQNNIKTAKTCLHFVIKINQLREYLEYIPDFI